MTGLFGMHQLGSAVANRCYAAFQAIGQFAQAAILNMWKKKARSSTHTDVAVQCCLDRSSHRSADHGRDRRVSADVFTISSALPQGEHAPGIYLFL